MRGTTRRVIAVLAAAFALTTAAAAPAAADPPFGGGPTIQHWPLSPCVIPRFDAAVIEGYHRMVALIGSATECLPSVTDGGFRIAAYLPGETEGIGEGYNIRLFPPKSEAPTVVRPFGTVFAPARPGDYGVCLLAGANERRLCAKVSVWIGGDGDLRTELKEIPVNDRLVAKSVRLGAYTGKLGPPDGDMGGTCGSCY